MNIGRIHAVFLRYFYLFLKMDHLCDLFYWPALDIVIWGMTTVWISHQQTGVADIALVVLTGVVFWQIIWRGNYEITVNLLQEFWNRNLVNLFATPLKLSEWITAIMLVGVVKICVGLLFGSLIVFLLYALNIFTLGWAFLPFCVSLTLSGWFMGFLSSAIMVYYGQRVQMLAWMTAYVFAPFSAVYYPVSALPSWAKPIAHMLPTTYVFEGMRKVLYEHTFSLSMFSISIALNLFYLAITMTFFKFMFEKSRAKGLARLE